MSGLRGRVGLYTRTATEHVFGTLSTVASPVVGTGPPGAASDMHVFICAFLRCVLGTPECPVPWIVFVYDHFLLLVVGRDHG